jgi:tetratricopeptide (TPR) repeat protein
VTGRPAGPAGSVADRLRLANDLMDVGRTGTAIELVRGVLAADPGHGRALCILTRCLIIAERYAEALAAADAAIAAGPEDELAHRLRSDVLRRLGRAVEASASADRAVQLDPQRWGTHWMRGKALVAAGQTVAAYRCALRARALGPADPSTYFLFTDVYEAAGELAAARREYLAGLAVDPGYHPLQGGLAYLDRLQWRDGDAARRYLNILAQRPADAAYRTRLLRAVAGLHRRLGLLGALVCVPVLAGYRPAAGAPLRSLLAAALLAGYLTVVARSHRRLGRLWRAQVMRALVTRAQVMRAQVTRAQVTRAQVTRAQVTARDASRWPVVPQLAVALPAVLVLGMGLLPRWSPPSVLAVLLLAAFLVQLPGLGAVRADLRGAWVRRRRRAAFRAELAAAGLPGPHAGPPRER